MRLFAILLAVALLAGCKVDEPQALYLPSGSPGAPVEGGSAGTESDLVDGLPSGAVGPLLVYMVEAGRITDIVTYDVGARSEAARFRLVADAQPDGGYIAVGGAGLLGRDVIVAERDRVSLRDLEGRETRSLFTAGGPVAPGGVLLSPDGRLLAATSDGADCDLVCLDVLDLATGDAVFERRAGLPFGAQPEHWRSDSAVLMLRAAGSHERGGLVVLGLDGTILATLGSRATVSPDGMHYLELGGQYAPWTVDQIGCTLSTTLTLHDFAQGRVLATVSSAAREVAIEHAEWAPDSSGVLYAVAPAPAPSDQPCSAASDAYAALPLLWRIMGVDGRSSPVSGPRTLLDEWHRAGRVVFICNGVTVSPDLPGSHPALRACRNDAGEPTPLEVSVDGAAPVALPGLVTVLGVIDIP